MASLIIHTSCFAWFPTLTATRFLYGHFLCKWTFWAEARACILYDIDKANTQSTQSITSLRSAAAANVLASANCACTVYHTCSM